MARDAASNAQQAEPELREFSEVLFRAWRRRVAMSKARECRCSTEGTMDLFCAVVIGG